MGLETSIESRMTSEATTALTLSEEEAVGLKSPLINSGHFALGLIRGGVVNRYFGVEIPIEQARDDVDRHTTSPKGSTHFMEFAPLYMQAITHAVKEADGEQKGGPITDEHLLKGLFRVRDSLGRYLIVEGVKDALAERVLWPPQPDPEAEVDLITTQVRELLDKHLNDQQ